MASRCNCQRARRSQDTRITDPSGMRVKTIAAKDVMHEAETVAADPLELSVPVGRSTQHGRCTLRVDTTLYSISPHMHRTGVHLRAKADDSLGRVMLLDGDHDFNHQNTHDVHQNTHDVGSFALKRGDVIGVDCACENTTDAPLHWGDSALAGDVLRGAEHVPQLRIRAACRAPTEVYSAHASAHESERMIATRMTVRSGRRAKGRIQDHF